MNAITGETFDDLEEAYVSLIERRRQNPRERWDVVEVDLPRGSAHPPIRTVHRWVVVRVTQDGS